MPQPVLDLVTARRWAMTARLMLAGAREQVDALNVFPVADGDTGTNMYLTLDGALDYVRGQLELGAGPDRLRDGMTLIARGMLLSARGNSGIILSQLCKGLADAVAAEVDVAGPEELARAFEAAAQTAWDSLADPVEGTILSVARAAAQGARAAVPGAAAVSQVVAAALESAQQALARTPEQLPALKAAGVVDAGGAGLVLVVEALLAVLEDRVPGAGQELPDWWVPGAAGGPLNGAVPAGGTGAGAGDAPDPQAVGTRVGHPADEDGEVEVMYLLTGSDQERADRLRRHLARLGSSVVVAGGPEEFSVHVHLRDPRAAVEAGSLAGMVTGVRATSLTDGADLGGAGTACAAQEDSPCAGPGVAVVACALGAGVTELFEQAGAGVVTSGPRHRASAGELLAAVTACGNPRVVLLPNDPDTLMVARAAAREAAAAGVQVDVVPTRSLVQGIAALAVLDPGAEHDAALEAMAEAAGSVRSGALTRADRPADTPVGPCRPGQWLGIVEDQIVAVADEAGPAAARVLDQLSLPGCEVLTVLLGRDADDDLAAVVDAAAAAAPHTPEVVSLRGDQPTYAVLLGAE